MKKFTSKMFAMMAAVLAFFATNAHAQVASATDLYGTYEFTCTMEVTADGQEYSSLFSDNCEVTIASDAIYDMMITGIAGSTITDGMTCNYSNGSIKVMNLNGSSFYYWGSPVVMGGPEGESPFDGTGWETVYTVDTNIKEITMPDFTAIIPTSNWSSAEKVLAKFTNCKLTFKEAENIEIPDASGEYHFTCGEGAYDYNKESSFPLEFDLTLTASDETYTTYAATIDFGEGYVPFNTTATFDGIVLTIAAENAYLTEDASYAIADYNTPSSLSTTLEFKYISETTLSLSRGMCISKATVADSETVYAYEQHYLQGFARKAAEEVDAVDFTGKYIIKSNNFTALSNGYEYPEEFEMVIETTTDYQTGELLYVVKDFLHGNIYDNTRGAYPCKAEGNILKLPVGEMVKVARTYMADDYSVYIYDVLFDGMGADQDSICLTYNADGTWSMDDFSLYALTLEYDTETWASTSKLGDMTAFYGNLEVTKYVPEPYDFTGTYWMSADVTTNVTDYTYPTADFKMVVKEAFDVDGNSVGFYVYDFVHGNIYNSTYAAYPCEIEGNTLKIPVGDGVKVKSISTSEDWLTTNYDILYNGDGGNTGYVTITANEDGTLTMDDFTFNRMTQVWEADYSNKTITIGDWSAKYSNITIQKEGDAIESVVNTKPVVKIYAANGTIYVAGEAANVQVYSLSGACVFNGVANQISGLNKGMYIVKCGDATVKVIL